MKNSRIAGALAVALAVVWIPAGQSVINVDRTRIIMNSGDRAVSVTLSNDSKGVPYLAQTWVTDSEGNRSSALMALPPLQRINGGQKSQVRVTQVREMTARLPQDRETLFWFNVRGIPPKPEDENVLQLTMQSQLKLLYRPAGVVRSGNDEPEKKLVVARDGVHLTLQNPTPYYITVAWLGADRSRQLSGFSQGEMVPPFGRLPLKAVLPAQIGQLWVGYVDDYGGLQMNRYTCDTLRCVR